MLATRLTRCSVATCRRARPLRATRGRIAAAQASPQQLDSTPAPGLAPPRGGTETLLCTRFTAHESSVSAALVLVDSPGHKELITASLDKTLARWTVQGCDLEGTQVLVDRIEVGSGAPVFSLAFAPDSQPSCRNGSSAPPAACVAGSGGGDGRPPPPASLYCGLAAKEIRGWQPGRPELSSQVRLNGHTGWVRALASSGKYLFSSGCNHLRQWDTTYSVPKEVRDVALVKGDILALATGGGKVFAASADGSIRAWTIDKGGQLAATGVREKAHDGRVTALTWHRNFVLSASLDGDIKAWDAETLKLVLEAKGAHAGERIHCLALGADGRLYSGGDDRLVRGWDPRLLAPAGAPLEAHSAGVRVLTAGPCEALVSGDAAGEVAVWALAGGA